MYGLPDSFIVGTTRRLTRMGRRKARYNTIGNMNWIWGWVILALLYGVARLFI